MKIEDNFLEQKEFDELQTLMMGDKMMSDKFVWTYNDCIDYEGEENKFQFVLISLLIFLYNHLY